MDRYKVSDRDVADPVRIRQVIDRLYEQNDALLRDLADLRGQVAKMAIGSAGAGPFDAAQLEAIQALIVGSTSTSIPAQNAQVPTVSALPPPNVSTPGELKRLSTDGVVYIFVGPPTSNWTAIGAAAAAHSILSTTHNDSLAAAVVRGDLIVGNATPAWARKAKGTANQALVMDGTGTDPGWGTIADTILSANVPLLNANNQFTGAQVLSALSALTLGSLAPTHGGYHLFALRDEEITLSTLALTTDSSTNILLGSSLQFPVLGFITQTISGGGVAKFRVGDPTTNDRFEPDNLNLTAGSGFWMYKHWTGGIATDAAGPTQVSAAKVRITVDAIPTQGKMRIVTLALTGSPPTS